MALLHQVIAICLIPFIFIGVNVSADSLNNYEFSCYPSRMVTESSLTTCSMVKWLTANAYSKTNFSEYNPSMSLSLNQQDVLAKRIIDQTYQILRPGTNVSTLCKQALNRYVCVQTFPYCPQPALSISGISYLPPCKLQCDQVNRICGGSHFDCSMYHNTGCSISVADGYVLLPMDQGPYNTIPTIYTVILAIWIFCTAIYVFCTYYVFAQSCFQICRIFIGFAIVKIAILLASVFFWDDCVLKGDVCASLLGLTIDSVYHLYETFNVSLFLCIAKGWNVTRHTLEFPEWRAIISIDTIFYIVTIIMTSMLDAHSNPVHWIVYTIIIYTFVYYFIVTFTLKEMSVLYSQVKEFTVYMPKIATEPLMWKYHMYVIFLLLVLVSIIVEIICSTLYATNASFISIILTYEIGQLLLLLTLCTVFRPAEQSPFFYMMPTSVNSNLVRNPDLEMQQVARARRIPIIEIATATDNPMQPMHVGSGLDGKLVSPSSNNSNNNKGGGGSSLATTLYSKLSTSLKHSPGRGDDEVDDIDVIETGNVDDTNDANGIELRNMSSNQNSPAYTTTGSLHTLGSPNHGSIGGATTATATTARQSHQSTQSTQSTQPTQLQYLGEEEIDITPIFRNLASNITNVHNQQESNILNTNYYMYGEVPPSDSNHTNNVSSLLRTHTNTATRLNNHIIRPNDQIKMIAVTGPDNTVRLGAFKTSTAGSTNNNNSNSTAIGSGGRGNTVNNRTRSVIPM